MPGIPARGSSRDKRQRLTIVGRIIRFSWLTFPHDKSFSRKLNSPSNTSRRGVMNKVIAVGVLVVLVVTAGGPGYAQNAFNQKDMVLSAGLGFGMEGLYGSSTLPPIFVAFETGLPSVEKVTVGGIVAYSGSSADFPGGSWKYKYIVIAARGSYHFLENNKDIDAYAGAGLGYDIVSSSVTYTNPAIHPFGYSAGASYFFFDIHAGARYYFTPKLAAMGELGYGAGFLRLGLSYKLN
jgi:hypothetical protein